MSCHASDHPTNGPARSQTAVSKHTPMKTDGFPVTRAVLSASALNVFVAIIIPSISISGTYLHRQCGFGIPKTTRPPTPGPSRRTLLKVHARSRPFRGPFGLGNHSSVRTFVVKLTRRPQQGGKAMTY